jgi:NAD(P)H-dependent flavin oxidoreductase YrpB (nitropropane dioxygenase family)
MSRHQIRIFRTQEAKHKQLNEEQPQKTKKKKTESPSKDSSYPLCLGFIGHSTFRDEAGWERFQSILKKHQPAVVQFFAPAVVTQHQRKDKTKSRTITNIHVAKECCGGKCRVLAQVGTVAEAAIAVHAGADGLIVQGSEAGGHGMRPGYGNATLSLATTVSSKFPDIPVIAAGGIVDGRGVAAMLMAGCDGAVLGTRLWATQEAIGHDSQKEALVQASSCDDVIRTTVFDTIQNTYTPTPWPEPYDSVGALRNEMTTQWEGKPAELQTELKSDSSRLAADYQRAGQGDVRNAAVLAGEGVGLIDKIELAYDVVRRTNQEAIDILLTKPKQLLGERK